MAAAELEKHKQFTQAIMSLYRATLRSTVCVVFDDEELKSVVASTPKLPDLDSALHCINNMLSVAMREGDPEDATSSYGNAMDALTNRLAKEGVDTKIEDLHQCSSSDCAQIESRSGWAVFDNPLWYGFDQPPAVQNGYLVGEIFWAGDDFPFWLEWFQGFLKGRPMNWVLQHRVALIPDPIWDEGSARVAEEIEKIRALFELEKRIEELEAERAAAETRQDRTGIGGNSPPEPIEDEAKVVEQVTIVWATIGELKEEAKKEQPDKAVFARIITILAAGLAKIRAFVAKAGAHTALLVYGAAVSSGTTALIQKPELLEAVIEAAKTALPFLH